MPPADSESNVKVYRCSSKRKNISPAGLSAQGEKPDPDAGRRLKKPVRVELLRLDNEIRKGKRGTPLKDVVKSLGLE